MRLKNKKVMIADDDVGIVQLLSLMLKHEGYDVCSTLNGATLLDIEKEFPDLILLDISMPGVDGRDICKILKQKELTKKIPIVMISASDDVERSVMDAGANDFLAKPFEMQELLKKIEKHLLPTISS